MRLLPQPELRPPTRWTVPSIQRPKWPSSSLSCFSQVICHAHEKSHDDYSIFCGNTLTLRTGLVNMAASKLGGYHPQAATKQPQNNSWELKLQTSIGKNNKMNWAKRPRNSKPIRPRPRECSFQNVGWGNVHKAVFQMVVFSRKSHSDTFELIWSSSLTWKKPCLSLWILNTIWSRIPFPFRYGKRCTAKSWPQNPGTT